MDSDELHFAQEKLHLEQERLQLEKEKLEAERTRQQLREAEWRTDRKGKVYVTFAAAFWTAALCALLGATVGALAMHFAAQSREDERVRNVMQVLSHDAKEKGIPVHDGVSVVVIHGRQQNK